MTNVPARRSVSASEEIVIQRGDPRWKKLYEIILNRSFQTGDFILSSGKPSKYLFQLRQTTMLGEGQAIIADIILTYMQQHDIHCIGGLVEGAVPIGQSVLSLAHARGYDLDFFFVRKARKQHGAGELIDGHVRQNSEVLMVDDVATEGNSIELAIQGLLGEYPSCFVKRAIVVVDREQGAAAALAHRRGTQLLSIFKKSDFPIPT